MTTYVITTKTGSTPDSYTDSSVFIKLTGTLGSSETKKLDNSPDNFKSGREDNFDLQCNFCFI